MKYFIISVILVLFLSACEYESSLRVRNLLSHAVVENVEWGGMPVCSRIIPGETCQKITIMEDEPYYDIHLPSAFPLKFYINVNGDRVFVQTRKSYLLNKDDELTIDLCDTTQVFNPLLEVTQ